MLLLELVVVDSVMIHHDDMLKIVAWSIGYRCLGGVGCREGLWGARWWYTVLDLKLSLLMGYLGQR